MENGRRAPAQKFEDLEVWQKSHETNAEEPR